MDLAPLVGALAADKEGLLSYCWSRTTDGQLEHISSAPYSDNALALERLTAFRESGPPWDVTDWGYAPCEALQLIRWTRLNEAD